MAEVKERKAPKKLTKWQLFLNHLYFYHVYLSVSVPVPEGRYSPVRRVCHAGRQAVSG